MNKRIRGKKRSRRYEGKEAGADALRQMALFTPFSPVQTLLQTLAPSGCPCATFFQLLTLLTELAGSPQARVLLSLRG